VSGSESECRYCQSKRVCADESLVETVESDVESWISFSWIHRRVFTIHCARANKGPPGLATLARYSVHLASDWYLRASNYDIFSQDEPPWVILVQ